MGMMGTTSGDYKAVDVLRGNTVEKEILMTTDHPMFSVLGADVNGIIFNSLEAKQVAMLSTVSKDLYIATSSNAVWRPLFVKVFGNSSILPGHSWKQAFCNAANL